SNLSKTNLEDICQNLGLLTEGNKVDLVQRLKIHSAKSTSKPVSVDLSNDLVDEGYIDNDESMNIDETDRYVTDPGFENGSTSIQTLRERALKSRINDITESLIMEPDQIQRTSNQKATQSKGKNKRQLPEDTDEDHVDSFKYLLVSELRSMRNVMTGFDNKLNEMAAQ
ncbi:22320_t:CDS:1, partial [Racocetra persica]